MMLTKNNFCTTALLLIGIGFLVATTVRVINTLEFANKATTADGIVIVTKHAKSHPRIEYTNAAGEKRWFLANEWITGFRVISYKTGQHVRVLYDPTDPVAYSVDDFTSLYTMPILGGILGIIFTVLGLCARAGKIAFKTKEMATPWISIFLGIILFVVASKCVGPTREFIVKTRIAEGVVIELPHGGSHPRVAYTKDSGEKDWIPANGMIFGYKVGERVRVLYDPADLAHPQIDDFGSLYAESLFFWLCGICVMAIGTLALFGLVVLESR